jgi:Na+:H+ antiporter, NhaA family
MARPIDRIFRPLRAFLDEETASGVLLLAAAVTAMLMANSPLAARFERVWAARLTVGLAGHVLDLSVRGWINDGLITLFFLVVGLEIKRELVQGELRDPRRAALPVAGAIGGMVVPATIYLAINWHGTGSRGWGVPMATDLAMALGAVALVGKGRVSGSLVLFLVSFAIADDIGSVLVITLTGHQTIRVGWLIGALAGAAAAVVLRAGGLRSAVVFVPVALAVWLCIHQAGAPTSVVGVFFGLLTPTAPLLTHGEIDEAELLDLSTVAAASRTVTIARHSVSLVERLEYRLHPWTSYLIVPLFALANAGVPFRVVEARNLGTHAVPLGIIVGRVVGKPIGIVAAAWLATKVGLAKLPDGVNWRQIAAVSTLGGIGFTVALFLAGQAFGSAGGSSADAVGSNLSLAKLAVLVCIVVSAAVGVVALRLVTRRAATGPAPTRWTPDLDA